MRVSVIIPVKNRAALLSATLKNILAQTLQPYEIIVVDDGSTDDIHEVANEFKSCVIFVHSEGKGPGAARNTGLKIATGNAIQFFDSDDLMTKNKLSVQAALLQEKNADFVYGPWVKAYNENAVWKQMDVIMQYHPIQKGVLADYVLEGWCNITQSALFTKELIDEVGFWREDLMTHEDFEYWFRIGKVAKKFFHENKSCVIYRQHKNQITDKAIAHQTRWHNGIESMKLIAAEIDYRPSIRSLLLFKARYALSKLGYVKKYGSSPDIKISAEERFLIPIYKLSNKVGRIQTGTSWQTINGVLRPHAEKFEEYIKEVVVIHFIKPETSA